MLCAKKVFFCYHHGSCFIARPKYAGDAMVNWKIRSDNIQSKWNIKNHMDKMNDAEQVRKISPEKLIWKFYQFLHVSRCSSLLQAFLASGVLNKSYLQELRISKGESLPRQRDLHVDLDGRLDKFNLANSAHLRVQPVKHRHVPANGQIGLDFGFNFNQLVKHCHWHISLCLFGMICCKDSEVHFY